MYKNIDNLTIYLNIGHSFFHIMEKDNPTPLASGYYKLSGTIGDNPMIPEFGTGFELSVKKDTSDDVPKYTAYLLSDPRNYHGHIHHRSVQELKVITYNEPEVEDE